MGGTGADGRHIRKLLDCALACAMSADFMLGVRNSMRKYAVSVPTLASTVQRVANASPRLRN